MELNSLAIVADEPKPLTSGSNDVEMQPADAHSTTTWPNKFQHLRLLRQGLGKIRRPTLHASQGSVDNTSSNVTTPGESRPESSVGDKRIPDGGWRAWLVVLGGFLNFCTTFGILNSFGTFQVYYASMWPRQSLTSISWIGGLQVGILFMSGLIIGPAFDKWGARALMIPGACLYLLSFLVASWARTFTAAVVLQGIVFGTANAMMFYPTTGVISEWFDRKRGLALGIAASGSSVGGIFWPILLGKLIEESSGPWAYRYIALISLPFLALSCYLIRERRGAVANDISQSQTELIRRKPMQSVSRVDFLALCLALFFIYLGMLVPFNLIPLYAEFRDLDSTTGNTLLALCYTGSVFGRIGAGWLADKLGRFNVLSTMATVVGILILCWSLMSSLRSLVAFSILFGLFSGGLLPLGSACVAQITPDLGNIGLRIGVMMAICSIGALGGGPISGALLEVTRKEYVGFMAANCFSGAATIAGAAALMLVRCIWGKRGPGKWAF